MTGREVRRVRRKLGLTQAAFAKKVGVVSVTVSGWELGRFKVGSTAAILIRLLGQLHEKEGKR